MGSIIGQKETDIDWQNCWEKFTNQTPCPNSFYKSTLVIPMTLRNETFSREFEKLVLNGDKNKANKKTMFGFLCIDHRHTDYFNLDSDVRIGYIFADILSLFLIVRKICIIKSPIYDEINELVKQSKTTE